MEPRQELLRRIQKVRGKWNRFIWFRGLAWVLGVGVAALVLAMTIAESTNVSSWIIVAMRVGLFLAVVAAVVKTLVLPLRRKPDNAQLARFVEEKHPGLEDRLTSAVELVKKAPSEHGPFGILLIRDALDRTRRIRFDDLVNRTRYNTFATLSGVFLAALLIAIYFSTFFFPYGSARLFAGFLEPPPAPAFLIEVTPGDTTVPRGSDVVLSAITPGFDPERAEVHLRYDNSSQWEASTMEVTPQTVPTWSHLLFNVQEPIRYFVEAGGHRSSEFVISVADLPRVESLDFTYNFPRYTRLASRTEVSALDMVALKGTTVDMIVHASQEVSAGRLVFADGREIALEPGAEQSATARVTVDRSTTFRIELTNTSGQKYLGLEEYAMDALDDQNPLVEFTEPGRDFKASTVEEVFTELRAEDDLGVNTLEIYFSVNGGDEQKIDLFSNNGTAPKDISGSYTFFLEEYEIQPGDFITYYGKAVDSARPANSVMTDIYFIEVRPFGFEYTQGQAGGGGGGGGGGGQDDSAEALSKRQKEIISATFNLIRDEENFEASEYSDNIQAIAESQSKLAEQTQTLMTRLTRRGLAFQDKIGQLTENMQTALEQMGPAAQQLTEEKLEDALPFEQRALQYLMRAEALFNEIQVTMGGGGGGGGGGGQSAEDLADLFDLELDQNKNQYETLQRGELSQNQEQEMEEALRKLQELAQRQQRMMEQQRRQAAAGGGGGGGQQMTAEELRRETERLARNLERLSRENNDRQMANVSRALQQAARNMQQAANGSSQEQQQASERAMEQLERAQRLLADAQGGSLEERLANLQQQARELSGKQGRIAEETERLAADPQNNPGQRANQIGEQKKEALDDLQRLEEGLESVQNTSESRETSARIRSAANAIKSGRLVDKMNQGQELLDNGYFEYAAQRERDIEQAVNDIERQLGEAAANAANTEEKQLQNALNQTSEAIRRLESMQRRMENEQNGRQGQKGQEGQQGQEGQEGQQGQGQQGQGQEGQQGQGQQGQGGEGQQGQQGQGGPRGGRSGDGFRGGDGTRGPLGGDVRQLAREWEERLRDIQEIRDQLGRNNDLTGDLNRIMEAVRRRMDGRYNGDPAEIEALRREVIDPFRSIELELSRELQVLIGKENIRSAADEEIPAGYKKLVEEYYKKLSDGPGPNN